MPGQQDSSVKRSGNRQLENAVERVSEAWFPVNPEVLRRVKAGIENDTYTADRHALLVELKKDVSLYGYCVKRLSQKRLEGTLPDDSGCLPVRLLTDATTDVLKEILCVSETTISPHKLSESSSEQLARLKEAIIAASVAELMSDQSQVDPETAYGTGLFRQLGMALIAWNFPHVYKRITAQELSNQDLDDAIGKMLGFSPASLGMSVVKRWDLSREVLIGMGDKDTLSDRQTAPSERLAGERLLKICEVGEVLAKAGSPERYPLARFRWEDALEELQETLGASALVMLRHKLDENCRQYIKLAPEAFNWERSLDPDGREARRKSPALLAVNNKYIERCPDEIKASLKQIYEAMDGLSLARESVEKLAHHVIPSAGFTRGCVYLIDTSSMMLVPRLVIGRAGGFQAVRFSTANAGLDPVAAAFRCSNPILEERSMINGKPVSYITGALGDIQKTGVLYLQFRVEADPQHATQMMTLFKAIRQTLSDCLLLN